MKKGVQISFVISVMFLVLLMPVVSAGLLDWFKDLFNGDDLEGELRSGGGEVDYYHEGSYEEEVEDSVDETDYEEDYSYEYEEEVDDSVDETDYEEDYSYEYEEENNLENVRAYDDYEGPSGDSTTASDCGNDYLTCQRENPVFCTAVQGRTGECPENGCRDSFEDCLEDVPLPDNGNGNGGSNQDPFNNNNNNNNGNDAGDNGDSPTHTDCSKEYLTCQEENPVVCTAEQGRTGECRGNGCRDSFEDCLEDVPLPGETRVQEQGGFFRNFIVNLFGGEEEEFSEYGYEEEVDDSVYEEDYEEEEMDEGEEMALDLENLVISWDQECMASARDSFGLCLEMCFYRDECELECHIAFEISLDSCRDDPKPPYEPPQDPQPPQEPPQDCASAAKSSFNLCLEMCDNRKCTDACRDEWESKCHKEFEIELGNCRSDPEPPQKPTPPQDPQPPYEPPQDPSSPQGCAADARSSFNMCLEMCSYDDQCAKCHLEFETALDNCRSDPEPPQDPIGPLGNPDDGDDDFMSCQKSCSLAQDYCAGKCREYVNPEDCLGNCNYNAVGCYENCDDQQNHWETLNFFEKIIDEILDFSWFEEELPLEDFEGQSCESIDWSDGCVLNDEGWGLTSGSPDSDSNCVHDIEDCCPDDPNFGIGSCEGSEEGDYYSYSYENSWNCQEESENHLAGCFEDCSNNVCSDSCIVTFQTDFEECGGSMGVRSYDDWVNPDDSNKESDCVAECWPDSHECRQGCLASCRNPEISCNWDEVNQCTQTCFDGGEGYNSCMDNCMGDDDDIIGRL